MTSDLTTEELALIDPGLANHVRGAAAVIREQSQYALADAEHGLAAAQEQARLIVAQATDRLHRARLETETADRAAQEHENRACVIDHAQQLLVRIREADQHGEQLAAEYTAAVATVEDTSRRLVELGAQREDTAAALAAARTAGSVDGVTQARVRLEAIDEITAALTAQRDAAQARATTIGETDWAGEYDAAVTAADALRRELSDLLDGLDPDRTQRRAVAMTNEYCQALMDRAHVSREDAATVAALLVAVRQNPEAAAAYFGGVGAGADVPTPQVVVVNQRRG